MTTLDVLRDQPEGKVKATLILAHGAGAPMDSSFMVEISQALVGRGIAVIRFEFPYMKNRRTTGVKRPPDREPILLDSWHEHLAAVCTTLPEEHKILIGGKSLGGRMASLIADNSSVDGLICLGYPFHPVGQPARTRTAHLQHLKTPTLILQGTRDPLGSRIDVEQYRLSSAINLRWLEDGDHDFKPRVKSGYSQQQHLQTVADHVAEFIHHL